MFLKIQSNLYMWSIVENDSQSRSTLVCQLDGIYVSHLFQNNHCIIGVKSIIDFTAILICLYISIILVI